MHRSQARADTAHRAVKHGGGSVAHALVGLIREAAACFDPSRPVERLLRDTAAIAGCDRAAIVRTGDDGDVVLVDSDPRGPALATVTAIELTRRPLAGAPDVSLVLAGCRRETTSDRLEAAAALAELTLGVLEARARQPASGSSGAPPEAANATRRSGGPVAEPATRAEQSLRWAAFLADASRVLASSLDYEATLERVAHLAIPRLADYCTVDVVEDAGVRRVAVAHADPAKAQLAAELRERFPVDPRWPAGIPTVLRSGKSELVADLTPELLRTAARDAEHLRLLEALGTRSAVCVPMIARGRPLGTITLVYGDSGRRYDPEDLGVADDLARRAAVAIDNARLYAEAQHTIRARDDFLSVASHELRTPVAALRLAAQGLARIVRRGGVAAAPPQALSTSFDVIDRQTDRLVQLVDKLLDVSRIDAGRLELELEDVDLAGLARDAVAQAGPQLEAAGSLVTVDAPVPVVGRWDRARLSHILQNLLSNAAKYGAGSPVVLSVESRGDLARLSIADRGIGIAPDVQSRIFERFERAVSAQNYGGLGLGLYVVRRLVEALGGRVFVCSNAGEGATFIVDLPIRGPEPSSGIARELGESP